MDRRGQMVVAGMLIVLLLVQCCWAQETAWENVSNGLSGVTAVCLMDGGLPVILAGTRYGISRSEDAGVNWKSVLRLHGQSGLVAGISLDEGRVYAATSDGLFVSEDRGMRWERIYRGSDEQAGLCLGVKAYGKNVVLATGGGLLLSSDQGKKWHKAGGVLAQQRIAALDQSPGRREVFAAATAHSLFVSKDGGVTWTNVYSHAVNGDGQVVEQDDTPDGEEAYDSAIRAVCFDPGDYAVVYLGLRRQVERSMDGGRTWQRLSDAGLTAKDIRDMVCIGKKLVVASGQSVFEFDQGRWMETGQRLAAGKVNRLAVGPHGNIYSATERGLFCSVKQGEVFKRDGVLSEVAGIPEIHAVQQAAIEYAQVTRDKIKQWSRSAGRRAWLPSVSVGLDRDTSELWHWEGGSTTRENDDELRRGKAALDWDVSLSWDLADLIWSDAQTSIDTRSRLLVQLRNEILDEVNKLYFEYVRTRAELDELIDVDAKKAAVKKLRLAELSASLDGLTGNKFSSY